jgi:hypothetical protein
MTNGAVGKNKRSYIQEAPEGCILSANQALFFTGYAAHALLFTT